MNQIEPKVISDLEIYDKVYPAINHTITVYGDSKLKELSQTVYSDQPHLLRRRKLLESIIFNPKSKLVITKELKKIKKTEADISWFFSDNKVEYEDLYFSKEWMNNRDLLTTKNFLKVYLPSVLVLVYLFIFMIMRYCGTSIGIGQYFRGIYMNYKIFVTSILSLMIGVGVMTSFMSNMFSSLYVVYQLYTIYNSVETSMCHYSKCDAFRQRFMKLNKTINYFKKCFKQDKFLLTEKSMISPLLNELDNIFSEKKISNLGYCILLKKSSLEYEKTFNGVLQYVGLLDALISISKLVTHDGYVFPTFDFNHPVPYVDIIGVRSPYMNPVMQILNDCHIGSPSKMVITGPNTSGKSTYMRNVMLSVIMAQTLGLSACSEIVLTPFSAFFTYMDIPNISRERDSLFEAEVGRCLQYCNILENMPSDKFSITIIDELFTGTNPKEGIASSYAVCDYIGNFTNSISLITTHFIELTELEEMQSNKFINMKFTLDRDTDGRFIRNFKIKRGVSNQQVAIELLHQKGYSSRIIEKALNYLDKIDPIRLPKKVEKREDERKVDLRE
jgi:hypothetical protein